MLPSLAEQSYERECNDYEFHILFIYYFFLFSKVLFLFIYIYKTKSTKKIHTGYPILKDLFKYLRNTMLNRKVF